MALGLNLFVFCLTYYCYVTNYPQNIVDWNNYITLLMDSEGQEFRQGPAGMAVSVLWWLGPPRRGLKAWGWQMAGQTSRILWRLKLPAWDWAERKTRIVPQTMHMWPLYVAWPCPIMATSGWAYALQSCSRSMCKCSRRQAGSCIAFYDPLSGS